MEDPLTKGDLFARGAGRYREASRLRARVGVNAFGRQSTRRDMGVTFRCRAAPPVEERD